MADPERPPEDEIPAGVAVLARVVLSQRSLPDVLGEVARVALATVPGCDGASLSLLDANGEVHTPAATDGWTVGLDEAQYRLDEGPCLQAIETGEMVRVDDFAGETRYPGFGPLAAAEHIGSCLSVPLDAGGTRLGGLNLYGRRARSYDLTAQAVAWSFAGPAAVTVANALAYAGSVRLAAQLEEALKSRAEIEQAKGILMAQSHVSAAEAFNALRRASQRENIKLRDIARRIVAGTGPGAGSGKPKRT
jgi:GAF domain-containing protein